MALTFADWTVAISDSLSQVIFRTINFIPNIFGAVLIIIVFWLIGGLLEWVVDQVFRSIGLPKLFESAKIEDVIKKTDVSHDTTGLISSLIKWIVLIVGFIAAARTLGLSAVEDFLNQVLGYAPSVVSGALILLVGVIFAHFMARVVRGSVQAAKMTFGDLAATVTKYSIIVFTFLAALHQLGIAPSLIQTLFTGFVALVAIAGGLAFGLGGQGVAKDLLERLRKDIQLK